MKRKYLLALFLLLIFLLIKNNIYFDIPVETLKKTYGKKPSKFVTINKVNVHYRDEGEGEPIVLIHGTGASLHTWNSWVAKLKQNYRVIRVDLPAFGLTGPSKKGDYSISYYTQFLENFLNKLNLNNICLVGNSLGGDIAWNYTAEHPDKVNKLVLIDTSGLPVNTSEPWIFKLARTPVLNKLFLYITPRYFIKNNLEQVYFNTSKISDSLITRYHKMALRKGNRQAFIERAKITVKKNKKEILAKLKRIQTKTLLIWGAKDCWIPFSNGVQIDSILPNSKLIILENSGHIPMEENPVESLVVFREFMRQ